MRPEELHRNQTDQSKAYYDKSLTESGLR